jgi:hypothetical protein
MIAAARLPDRSEPVNNQFAPQRHPAVQGVVDRSSQVDGVISTASVPTMASSKLAFVPMNVLAQALRRSRTALCSLDEFTLRAECRQGKTSNKLTGRMLSIHLGGRQNIATKSKRVAQMADYTADLQAAIASYAPDRQIITFSPAMLILPRDGERENFETAVQMSYFFHEWIHYLHNVSTVHGMSAYSSFIGLWNAFRHTTGELGLGQGRFITSSAEELKTRAYLDVISSTRRPADKPLFGEPSVDMCRIVSCKPAGNFNDFRDHLDVAVEVTNERGDAVTYPKEDRPHRDHRVCRLSARKSFSGSRIQPSAVICTRLPVPHANLAGATHRAGTRRQNCLVVRLGQPSKHAPDRRTDPVPELVPRAQEERGERNRRADC